MVPRAGLFTNPPPGSALQERAGAALPGRILPDAGQRTAVRRAMPEGLLAFAVQEYLTNGPYITGMSGFLPTRSPLLPLERVDGFDLAAAMAAEEHACAAPPGRTLPDAAQQTETRRAMLECMLAFAIQAYLTDGLRITGVGGFEPTPRLSSDVMKTWEKVTADGVNVVIAFAGTRAGNLGDMWRDLQSQKLRPHANALDPSLGSVGSVGAGWSERWRRQARPSGAEREQLGDALKAYAAQAAACHGPLLVTVIGHSLGAAVASVAGNDIAQFLKAQEVESKTTVYSFNAPRMGSKQAQDRYQEKLAQGRDAPAAGRHGPLVLRQFTRHGDPVQSVPFNQCHPMWKGTHDLADRTAYHAASRAMHLLDVTVNHVREEWALDVGHMPDQEVSRIFDAR